MEAVKKQLEGRIVSPHILFSPAKEVELRWGMC
jgi:hypothetical protein